MPKLRATPSVRFLMHTVVGIAIGLLVVHPLSMAVYAYQERGVFKPDVLYDAFSMTHVGMSVFFAGLGGAIGLLYGVYAHRFALLYSKVRELSVTDPLTSLYNRRHFMDVLEGELQRATRYARAFSLVLVDVDHFKCYNDTHGHVRGDDLLKELASLLSDSIRDVDTLCRYGGEEFAIVLPECGSSHAQSLATRVLQVIQTHSFRGEETQPLEKVTVSIGVASYPEDAQSLRELMKRADIALYSAKDMGRNQVCVYDKSMSSITESTMGIVT